MYPIFFFLLLRNVKLDYRNKIFRVCIFIRDKDTVLKFVRAINKRDIDGIHKLMSKDHIFIDMEGDIHKGKVEINWKEYFNIFPDYRINIEKIFHKNNNIYIY